MTRRPAIVLAGTAVAAVAGVWAGGAVSSSPRAPAAMTNLEHARELARAELRSASTAEQQRASERRLAALHRDAARTMPAQRASLERAADAYDTLAAADTPAAYAHAARAVTNSETALSRPSGGEPAIPPAVPLILLAAGASGFALSSRRRPAIQRAEAPVRDTPSQPKLTWDARPPGL